MKFSNLKAALSVERILEKLNCTAASPSYETFREELLAIRETCAGRIHPEGALAFGVLTKECGTKDYPAGTEVVYVIITLGEDISTCIGEFFREGDYVKGMLADAMADTCLFELEESWGPQLIESCREKGKGIAMRLEPPEGLPMEAHRDALTAIGAAGLPNLSLTKGLMLRPVKSICHVFVLTDEADKFHIRHDCSRCGSQNCPMRKSAFCQTDSTLAE